MLPSIDEVKLKARILQSQILAEDGVKPVLGHCFQAVCKDLGFNSYEHFKAVLKGEACIPLGYAAQQA